MKATAIDTRTVVNVLANALQMTSTKPTPTGGDSDGNAKPEQQHHLIEEGGNYYLWHVASALSIEADVEAALDRLAGQP